MKNVPRGEMEKHLNECTGAVPMSEVRKVLARITTLEQEAKKPRRA